MDMDTHTRSPSATSCKCEIKYALSGKLTKKKQCALDLILFPCSGKKYIGIWAPCKGLQESALALEHVPIYRERREETMGNF